MKSLPLLFAALAFAPLPLAAQTLHDTHELRWAPSGKTPAATWHYRGKADARAAADCRTAPAPVHLAGRTPMHATPATNCGAQEALVNPDRQIARN